MRRRGLAIVGALLFVSAPALARQEYYDAIAAQTGTCADCSLCHPGPVGLSAPTEYTTKPFLYHWAIDTSRTLPIAMDGYDSDGDGASDLDELMNQGDPNDPLVGPGGFECPTGPLPEYGCVRIARGPSVPDGWALLAAALPALLLLRRRRSGG